jgi:cAMP-dependent protein kinase regulator
VENVFRPSSGGPAAPSPPSGDAVQTPLFQSLSREELTAVIHGLELRNFEPGEIVMSAGEPGDSMFILTTGTARAYMRQSDGRHVLLRVMGDGDFFGEISILTGGARTATITAVTALDVLELDKATLDSITKTYPRVREVLQEFYRERARHTAETARRSIAKRRS